MRWLVRLQLGFVQTTESHAAAAMDPGSDLMRFVMYSSSVISRCRHPELRGAKHYEV
jgi:hypothetical protein